jgi:hypothetical protein|tara:strand:- start:380 stop:547 length:168 start_codon:yes stop_codon:yes gene_type:complete
MLVSKCFVSNLKDRIIKWFKSFKQKDPKHTPNMSSNDKKMLKPFKAGMPRGTKKK